MAECEVASRHSMQQALAGSLVARSSAFPACSINSHSIHQLVNKYSLRDTPSLRLCQSTRENTGLPTHKNTGRDMSACLTQNNS